MLTKEYLNEIFDYDRKTGNFFHKTKKCNNGGRVKIGDKAGHYRPFGSTTLTIDSKYYPASKVAWFLEYGEWPTENINRIDKYKGYGIRNLKLSTTKTPKIKTVKNIKFPKPPKKPKVKNPFKYISYLNPDGQQSIITGYSEDVLVVRSYYAIRNLARVEEQFFNPRVEISQSEFNKFYSINGFVTIV